MRKPTPQELEKIRAAIPEGSPRFGYREMTIEVLPRAADGDAEDAADGGADEDQENAPLPIALSSEAPVLRYDWWTGDRYYEVLDHAKSSVDLSYARDGMPFVMSHRAYDGDAQHGIIENVTVDKDRKLRGAVRFSRAPRSQEIAQDMRDGIRKKISIGYIVGDTYEETKNKGEDYPTRRYTSWMPIEGSTVPVPADYDVGVERMQSEMGRAQLARFLELYPPRAAAAPVVETPAGESAAPSDQLDLIPSTQAPKAEERSMPDQAPAPVATPVVSAGPDRTAENAAQRVDNITAMAVQHGCQDKLSDWLRSGATETEVVREINGILAQRIKDGPQTVSGPALSEREQKRFNFARALILSESALEKEAGRSIDFGFEREVLEEVRKSAISKNGGAILPMALSGRAGIDSATSTLGGAFKFTQGGDFINMLRNRTSVMRAGSTVLTGLSGPVTFPKQNGTVTAGWVAENPGSDQAESDLTTTTVTLAFKTIQANTRVSRQALFSAASGNYDLEQIIRADLAAAIGIAIDLGALNGSGSSNQPTGILQNTSVGSATALGANGGTMAWTNWVNLETVVADANADTSRMAYITNTKQRGIAKGAGVLGNTNSGIPVWTNAPGEMDGIVNGYRAIASNQVPRNLTKGTSTTVCSAVLFGAFEHCLIGQFGSGFEVLVDPYSKKNQNMIELTAWNFIDVALRYPEAFSTIKDAL